MKKQQIFIFEGIDMVGKTTIAKQFANVIGVPYYCEYHRDKWYDHTIDILYAEEARIQMLEQIGFSVVLDRSYPSEYAYAKAYRRPLFEHRIYELDHRYSLLGAKIIYCYKPKEKWQEDKTKLIDFMKYEFIDFYYKEIIRQSKCHSLFLDTSDENTFDQIETILNAF